MKTPRFTRRKFLRNVALAGGAGAIGTVSISRMTSGQTFPISDHCDGRQFFNPRRHINRSWLDVLR